MGEARLLEDARGFLLELRLGNGPARRVRAVLEDGVLVLRREGVVAGRLQVQHSHQPVLDGHRHRQLGVHGLVVDAISGGAAIQCPVQSERLSKPIAQLAASLKGEG